MENLLENLTKAREICRSEKVGTMEIWNFGPYFKKDTYL